MRLLALLGILFIGLGCDKTIHEAQVRPDRSQTLASADR